jgi:hypothetical protein
MTPQSDKLFKVGLLAYKVGLHEENMSGAAVSTPGFAFEAFALCMQLVLGPEATFLDKEFHAFKPPRYGLVIFRKVKLLWQAICKDCWTHLCAVLVVCPALVGRLRHLLH